MKKEEEVVEPRSMDVLDFFGLIFDGMKHTALWLAGLSVILFLFGILTGWALNALL